MHYKLASIISTSSQNTGKTNEVYISQPDATKEELAGKLFIVAEVESNKANALKIINFLINTLNHNYYQNEKVILRERISTIKIEHIFETALAKTNKELIEFLKNEKIKITPSSFNITVGVIHQNNLHFSNIGKNRALLIYEDNNQKLNVPESGSKYKIADVGRNEEKEKQPKEITKIFSDVISGQVPEKGYFLFANEALPEYLTNKQIIEILTKLPPASAAEQIKNTLEKVNAYISFLGIIIKNTTGLPQTALERKIEKVEPETSDESVDNLIETEAQTEKLLSPSGMIDFKKWFKVPTGLLEKVSKKSSKTSQKTIALKDKVFVSRKSSLSLNKITKVVKDIFAYIVGFFAYLYHIITDKDKLAQTSAKIKSTPSLAKNKSRNSIKWVKALNKRNKTLFVIASIFILLAIVSVGITSFNNKRVAKEEEINSLIQSVEQKQNQIDANLLYSNEDGAKKLLAEVAEALDTLSLEFDENDEQYQSFITKNNEQLEKIQHFVIIENPQEIANFSELNSQANASNITLATNKVYAGDNSTKSIYSLNLEDSLVTALTDLSTEISTLDDPIINKDNNLYFLNNSSLLQLNTETDELSSVTLTIPGSREDIAAMAGYNNRIYLLDKTNSQIYRYSESDDGFTRRDNWVQEESDFSNATGLSIDGNIYVLNTNGEVYKYLSGKLETFKIDSVEPALTSANKLFATDADDGYIYVLESTTNRLVVFDKDGDFVLQYKSDKFNNLKDFAIDAENHKIYFLNNNSVYVVDGEHFE